MQEQMAKTQAELENQSIEVSAGGGKVKVTANGAGDIVAIKIDREVVDPNDIEFLEEIVLSAVKQAVEQGKALAQSEMTKITGFKCNLNYLITITYIGKRAGNSNSCQKARSCAGELLWRSSRCWNAVDAHVWAQGFGHQDRAIRLLVSLNQSCE